MTKLKYFRGRKYFDMQTRNKNRKKPANTRSTKLTVKENIELMDFLQKSYEGKSRSSIKSMLTHRQVSVDGVVVTQFNNALAAGQVVEVFNGVVPQDTNYSALKIVHEDKDIIVINKNTGLLSISTDGSDQLTAYSILKEHVKISDYRNKVFVVHRLDKDTSGLMVYAKSEDVKRMFQMNWSDMVLERTYVLVVEGQVSQDAGTITSWLKENEIHQMISSQVPNDGELAITHFKVLARTRQNTLIEATLETGRKNQIRVHMKDIGYPVVGDKKYGAKTSPINRLGLHANLLVIRHPSTGKTMEFKTPIPRKFAMMFENNR